MEGGIGFKDFVVHKALRCLQNPNEYWATMLRGIYCGRGDVWTVKPNVGISWVWRSLLHGRELLKQQGR